MRYIIGRRPQRSAWKGLLAGLAGGLAASWGMNQFQKVLAKAVQGRNGSQSSDEGDITGKTADIIYHAITDRHLGRDGRRKGGVAIHYTFGTALGGAYGAVAERAPKVKAYGGLPYGALLFAGADEAALPLLKLSKKPREYPASTHLYALGSHLVYGATLEGVRRLMRRLLR